LSSIILSFFFNMDTHHTPIELKWSTLMRPHHSTCQSRLVLSPMIFFLRYFV
jgi:hypothetical protein